MAKLLRQRIAQLEVENWNLKHPVGTEVQLRKFAMSDGKRFFETVPTRTRTAAFVCNSGEAVCFFEGVSGYYLLDRATPVQKEAVPCVLLRRRLRILPARSRHAGSEGGCTE